MKILYIQYSNSAAYPCLHHSSRLLARQGWKVQFLQSGALGVEMLRFAPAERISVHRAAYATGGWRQKLCYAAFCVQALGWFLFWRPDWVYLSDPLSSPIGWLLSFLPGARLIYHEHDSPNRQGSTFFMRWVFRIRQKMARRVNGVILPNEARAAQFKRETGRDLTVFCVHNVPAKEEIRAARAAAKSDDLWLLYQGSIDPARVSFTLLDALAQTPSTLKLMVIGYETIGHQGYLRQFQDKAAEKGLAARVNCIGALSRHELMSQVRRCDIGLATMPKQSGDINIRFISGASNKPFDYLACGLALVVSSLPDWEQMFVSPGYGLSCDPENSQSIARALTWFVTHPVEMRQMGEKGRQRLLAEWNYERAFQPVLDQLNGN